MQDLTLSSARIILRATHEYGVEHNLKPLSVAILDRGGHLIAFERPDGASPGRFEIARGKAYGTAMLHLGGKAQQERAETQAFFMACLNGAFDGKAIPVQGGILVRDTSGAVIGAVGVTGDTSENDANAGAAGVEAAGLTAEK